MNESIIIRNVTVTYDLHILIPKVNLIKCSKFANNANNIVEYL